MTRDGDPLQIPDDPATLRKLLPHLETSYARAGERRASEDFIHGFLKGLHRRDRNRRRERNFWLVVLLMLVAYAFVAGRTSAGSAVTSEVGSTPIPVGGAIGRSPSLVTGAPSPAAFRGLVLPTQPPSGAPTPRPSGGAPLQSAGWCWQTSVLPLTDAASCDLSASLEPSGLNDRVTASPTPRPSGGIGEPASYCKPGYCETPTPKPPTKPIIPSRGTAGEATWWASFGSGLYAAIRPDLGTKGDTAIVCGGSPFHCLTLPIITTCACLGPNSDRLIDLSIDAFRSFADPSAGVVRVTVQVLER